MKNLKIDLTLIKTHGKVLFILMLFTFLITSCGKKKGCTNTIATNFDSSAEEDDGSCQVAGLGGATTIVAFPQHHGKPIYNLDSIYNYPDTAYVKFNAQDQPANLNSYDAIFTGTPGENHVHLEGLKPGKYYIFMAGFDTSLVPDKRVKGGLPYTLTQASGELNLNVAVTEE